jgi:hypothetical protein
VIESGKYLPSLTINKINNRENGLIAEKIKDKGFRLNQRMPVKYAMRKICINAVLLLTINMPCKKCVPDI